MKRALRILLWIAVVLALLFAAAVYLLYAPRPPEPRLSGHAVRQEIRVAERGRSYLLYAPARAEAAPALVIVFHGSMGSPAEVRRQSGFGFDRLADRHGFVVAYPQGYEGNWNDCRRAADFPARRLGVDDTLFFDALVARLRRERRVDPGRVFVAGVSNGGSFVLRLALERPDRVAAAAVFAASLSTDDNSLCVLRGTPPPILFVNGTDDPINPFEGGEVTLFGFSSRGTVRSAEASAAWFAARERARGPMLRRIAPSDPSDSTRVEERLWRGPRGEVALFAVIGGGHVLPQTVSRPPRLLGRVTTAIDGPAEAWDFFRRQPRRQSSLARSASPG
jgi:polyhydroxybutyrate depolymerase